MPQSSDNHIGVSLNFIRRGYGYGRVVNSTIIGSSPASASCGQSTVCRAMSGVDALGKSCGSVFGPTWRHVGIVSSQYTNVGAWWCGRLPQ
jgi:hypothetical protein